MMNYPFKLLPDIIYYIVVVNNGEALFGASLRQYLLFKMRDLGLNKNRETSVFIFQQA
jgi:hypothetical protein